MFWDGAPFWKRICTVRVAQFKIYGLPAARKALAWDGSAFWTLNGCQRFWDCRITSCPLPISAWVMSVNFRMRLTFNAPDGGNGYRFRTWFTSIVGRIEPAGNGTLDYGNS